MSTVAEALDELTRTLAEARDLRKRNADPLTVSDQFHRARELLHIVEEEITAQSAAQSLTVPGRAAL